MIASALPLLLMLSRSASSQDGLSAAREQVRQGNCKAAVQALEALPPEGAKPGSEARSLLLAVCYERLGQTDRALRTLRDALQNDPKSPALRRTLGEFLFRQGPDSPEPGDLLASAVEADPKDPEARHYYAQWAYLNNRDQICADQEQEAVKLPGLNDLAQLQMYTLAGLCLNRLDKADGAKIAFEKAYSIDLHQQTFDPAMAYQYIQFLIGRGENGEAQKVVDETLSRSPQFGPAHLERAKSLDHQRQPAKAIQEAEAALNGEGNDDSNIRAAHVILAKCYFILGMTKEAEIEQQWVETHAAR